MGVKLPGVLAVEDDGYGQAGGPGLGDGLDAAEQVGGGVRGGKFLVIEPDQVRQHVVAEEYLQRTAGQGIGGIKRAGIVAHHSGIALQGRGSDRLRTSSSEAVQAMPAFSRRRSTASGEAAFGGPYAARPGAECFLHQSQRVLQLRAGVLFPVEIEIVGRQARVGLFPGLRVKQERQDRVIKGAGAEFDPALVLKFPVFGDDAPQDLVFHGRDRLLVALGKILSLAQQGGYPGIVVFIGLIEIGQLEPDLQIAELGRAENFLPVGLGRLAQELHFFLVKRFVAPVGLDVVFVLDGKEMADQELDLFRAQVGGRLAEDVKEFVAGAA